MTEPIPATPGWVDERLDTIFARLPDAARPAAAAFAECLAQTKSPASPSDLLGAEFEPCHAALRQALLRANLDDAAIAEAMRQLEALEAEVAAQS